MNPFPSLQEVEKIVADSRDGPQAPNLVPLCIQLPADLLTPTQAYLKISHGAKSRFSFLFESAMINAVTTARYSFLGTNPLRLFKSDNQGDPLHKLEREIADYRVASIPYRLPPLTGGLIGYVGYDCVRYFEPKVATAGDPQDVLKLPESLFMLFDTVIAFDHFFNLCQLITYVKVPDEKGNLKDALHAAYEAASKDLKELASLLQQDHVPLPEQPPIKTGQPSTSNVGQKGYEAHVTQLKKHVSRGDIIQAVPSHRIARPTTLHPFNIYRQLRTVNPSPYLFYIDCEDFCIIGASPELLVKKEAGRIITHPIAGTVKRSSDPAEDDRLSEELRNSLKDRAEHVMLVDLARNDINRVCDPLTTRVDRLMAVEKFSHVQHLVSQVSGVLRPGETRWTAFRSIFPAGTVSGAPKVKAMELIAGLEKEKRGVYAGAVGYFGFPLVAADGSEIVDEGEMDTCIALRTMVYKDGVAYLQAGGGIVFDSVEYDEWMETMNKLGANIRTIETAEQRYLAMEKAKTNGAGSGH